MADDVTDDHDLAKDITDDLNSKVRRESTVSQSVSQSGGCSNCRPMSPPPPPPPPPTLAQVHKEPIKQNKNSILRLLLLQRSTITISDFQTQFYWALFIAPTFFYDIIRISVSLLLRHPNEKFNFPA